MDGWLLRPVFVSLKTLCAAMDEVMVKALAIFKYFNANIILFWCFESLMVEVLFAFKIEKR